MVSPLGQGLDMVHGHRFVGDRLAADATDTATLFPYPVTFYGFDQDPMFRGPTTGVLSCHHFGVIALPLLFGIPLFLGVSPGVSPVIEEPSLWISLLPPDHGEGGPALQAILLPALLNNRGTGRLTGKSGLWGRS